MSIVALQHLRAVDAEGPRGKPRGLIAGANLFLGAGVHVVLGAPEDGTYALIDALSGRRRPERGKVLVRDREPHASPEIRARIGVVGSAPRLPDAPSVRAITHLVAQIRGQGAEAETAILASLGLSELASRDPRALGFAEARAVEAAIALSVPDPALLVLHEPLTDMALADPQSLRARLGELARGGACVVVTTSSPADARSLGDRIYLLQAGRFLRWLDGSGVGLTPGHALPITVWLAPGGDVRALAAEIAKCPEVFRVAWDDAREGGLASLRVSGAPVSVCALAVTDAAIATGVALAAIATEPPSLGDAQGFRHAPPAWTAASPPSAPESP